MARNPRGLFWLFVGVNMVPSACLVFTEPLSAIGRVILLSAPLGAYLLLFSLSRRTGVTQLWLIPLLVFHAFQLVLFYLYGESVIAADMFLNLPTTNATEAGELLDMLKKRNFQIGISSSNSTELIRTVLKAHEIEDYFGCITTCCQVPAGKPAPDVYLETAKGLGIAPEDCLVFEDVPMGILAGKRAGMKVCAVDDKFSRNQEKEKRKLADWYIQDYYEVLRECL